MRKSCILCVMALAVAVAGPNSLFAQIRLPVFDPDAEEGRLKGVAFEPAKEVADFKHGTLLAVTLKDGSKAVGTFVRSDAKTKRIFLRTRAQAPPVAYAEADLKLVEKGVRKPAGGIIPIGDPGARQNVVEPEITKQTIHNGARRSVRIFSSVVSPGERDILDSIERAENDLLALEAQEGQRFEAIDTEIALQAARLGTQRLINGTLGQNLLHQQLDLERSVAEPILLLAPSRLAPLGFPLVMPPRTNLTANLPEVDRERLSKARDNLRVVLNRSVFEEGRIVAVVLAE
jgi:hypothetical protein